MGTVRDLLAGGGTFFALVLIAFLLWRGGVGRLGILLAFAAGSAVGFAGTLWTIVLAIGGAMITAFNAIAGAAAAAGVVTPWGLW